MIKTVSLKLAKQLKEAGFLQESLFCYVDNQLVMKTAEDFDGFQTISAFDNKSPDWFNVNDAEDLEVCAAPTSDELLDELPDHVFKDDKIFQLRIIKAPTYYSIYYDNSETISYIGTDGGGGVCEESLAEAAAKMWLYLKAQGLLKGTV